MSAVGSTNNMPPAAASRTQFLVMATGKRSIEAVKALLVEAGFEIDADYAPVVVDDRDGSFVLRGRASPETIGALADVPGLAFYPDLEVQRTQ